MVLKNNMSVCVTAEKHLREFTGGHGLLGPEEPRDWEPVRGAFRGCGGRPVVEGEGDV